jgi:hypothetical protein
MEMSISVKTYCFPFFFNWGHFWLHVDLWCFAVLFYSGALLPHQTMNHIYIILLPVSTLWYIICSLFNHALVLYIWVPSHNPNFPSLVVSIILVLSDCKLFQPSKKCLKSPVPPFAPTFIFSYQSMKLLQESTLQGCHKRNSFDHSCTLRRVYISILLQ